MHGDDYGADYLSARSDSEDGSLSARRGASKKRAASSGGVKAA